MHLSPGKSATSADSTLSVAACAAGQFHYQSSIRVQPAGLPLPLAGRLSDDARWCDHLGFPEPLAAGTVKQNRIAIRFPNRREAQRARSMQAKVNAAGSATPYQNLFGEGEIIYFELVLFAECFANKLTYRR
jgi:hypothetical protein